MKYLLLFLAASLAWCPAGARAQFKVIAETEMAWPGIHYQIFWLKRLPPDRLVVGVRMIATADAPHGGTLVGYPVPIPAGLTEDQIRAGDYRPRPFSLASSVMVDEATQQEYPALDNISPPGREYYPSQGLGTLTPGQALLFTVQFQIPPPPPPPGSGQAPAKQTLSFLLTEAKGPIKSIPLPPPGPVAP